MDLHIIRHGMTMANEKRLYCGHADISLTEEGVSTITDLKERGEYPHKADFYFTSGLLRTEQTLELIYGPVHREVLSAFAEYNFGSFEMKSHDELCGCPSYQEWITDETGHISCPGGESKNQFKNRILAGYEQLVSQLRGKNCGAEVAILICHGGVIAYLMDNLFPGERNFYEWQPKPGYGHKIMIEQ